MKRVPASLWTGGVNKPWSFLPIKAPGPCTHTTMTSHVETVMCPLVSTEVTACHLLLRNRVQLVLALKKVFLLGRIKTSVGFSSEWMNELKHKKIIILFAFFFPITLSLKLWGEMLPSAYVIKRSMPTAGTVGKSDVQLVWGQQFLRHSSQQANCCKKKNNTLPA